MFPNDPIIEEDISAVQDIEVNDKDVIAIDVQEAAITIGEPNTQSNHALLNGRELPDQHPITAITDLSEELDRINALKSVCSDKYGAANYYEWSDGAHDEYGLFVSFVPHTSTIQICNGDDIFGVTVDTAGFIGGQTKPERDNAYALVATSGIVKVRCELDVNEGDYVVPNASGYAEKTDTDCGYKVIAKADKYGVDYAVISLGVQACTTNALGIKLKTLEKRTDATEIDIAAAMQVAQQAYSKAGENAFANQNMTDKIDEIYDKVDNVANEVDQFGSQISNAQIVSARANAIANDAVVKADNIRNEAVDVANSALERANQLEDGLTEYIDNGLATKAEVATVEKLDEENKLLISQNAENYTRMLSSVDKYSVGEYSQAYGLTLAQAVNILKEGMVYIPTPHSDSDTHSEHYTTEDGMLVREFTSGYYYVWTLLSNGTYMWSEKLGQVWFGTEKPASAAYTYWYDGDTLYLMHNGVWTQVAMLTGNANNRIVSLIRQNSNEIALEVTNARGSAANLNARITDSESNISTLATHVIGQYVTIETWDGTARDEDIIYYAKDTKLYWYYKNGWKSTEKSYEAGLTGSMAVIEQKADDAGSSISLVVNNVNGEKIVNAASIVAAVNDSGSEVGINADKIVMTGKTVFLTPEDVGKNGETIIDGGRITTGAIQSNNYKYTSGKYSQSGTAIDLNKGYIRSKNFAIDDEGNVLAKNAHIAGHIEASTGQVGKLKIAQDGSISATGVAQDENGNDVEFTSFAIGSNGNASFAGHIVANSGSIGQLEISEDGSLWSENFGIFSDGSAYLTGTVVANDGNIAGLYITESAIKDSEDTNLTESDQDAVYIGTDGFRYGDAIWIRFEEAKAPILESARANISIYRFDEGKMQMYYDGLNYPLFDRSKDANCLSTTNTVLQRLKALEDKVAALEGGSSGTTINRSIVYVGDSWTFEETVDSYNNTASSNCINVYDADGYWEAEAVSVGNADITFEHKDSMIYNTYYYAVYAKPQTVSDTKTVGTSWELISATDASDYTVTTTGGIKTETKNGAIYLTAQSAGTATATVSYSSNGVIKAVYTYTIVANTTDDITYRTYEKEVTVGDIWTMISSGAYGAYEITSISNDNIIIYADNASAGVKLKAEKAGTTVIIIEGNTFHDTYTYTIAKSSGETTHTHTEETISAVAATCTTTGLTEGMKCSVCGEILVAQQVVPAKGHTEVTVTGKAATCSATGLTDGKKCSVCGVITVAQETIPISANAHTWDTPIPDDNISTGKSHKCTSCGVTERIYDKTIGEGDSFTISYGDESLTINVEFDVSGILSYEFDTDNTEIIFTGVGTGGVTVCIYSYNSNNETQELIYRINVLVEP